MWVQVQEKKSVEGMMEVPALPVLESSPDRQYLSALCYACGCSELAYSGDYIMETSLASGSTAVLSLELFTAAKSTKLSREPNSIPEHKQAAFHPRARGEALRPIYRVTRGLKA